MSSLEISFPLGEDRCLIAWFAEVYRIMSRKTISGVDAGAGSMLGKGQSVQLGAGDTQKGQATGQQCCS